MEKGMMVYMYVCLLGIKLRQEMATSNLVLYSCMSICTFKLQPVNFKNMIIPGGKLDNLAEQEGERQLTNSSRVINAPSGN